MKDDLASYQLDVPNREVRTVFKSIIQSSINNSPEGSTRLQEMLQAFLAGDIPILGRILNEFVINTLSYYDTSGRDVEKVYQAFLLGMLINLHSYEVSSNRESGYGRYDILMRPKNLSQSGIVMEPKVCSPEYGDMKQVWI